MLLQGSDGDRNHWFLDTLRGRDTAKLVVKSFIAAANESGNSDKVRDAQEMARQWLPERKYQPQTSDAPAEAASSASVKIAEVVAETPKVGQEKKLKLPSITDRRPDKPVDPSSQARKQALEAKMRNKPKGTSTNRRGSVT